MEIAIKELESFIGSWNGKDDKFIHEGEIFTEDDVRIAEDALKILKN